MLNYQRVSHGIPMDYTIPLFFCGDLEMPHFQPEAATVGERGEIVGCPVWSVYDLESLHVSMVSPGKQTVCDGKSPFLMGKSTIDGNLQ
jgi:hypothetical protein